MYTISTKVLDESASDGCFKVVRSRRSTLQLTQKFIRLFSHVLMATPCHCSSTNSRRQGFLLTGKDYCAMQHNLIHILSVLSTLDANFIEHILLPSNLQHFEESTSTFNLFLRCNCFEIGRFINISKSCQTAVEACL